MSRHVLILAYDFPPRGATGVLRITKFARYLPEFGWHPVVVAAAVRGGMRDEGLLSQLPPDLDVIRIDNPFAPGDALPAAHSARPTTKARVRGMLRQLFIPDGQILWVPAAVRAATNRIRHGDIDALMTTAPPYSVHMAGSWLKRRHPSLPWLMDLRDIWSENPAITSVVRYKLQRACERACLRRADHITTATDGQRRLLQSALAVPEERIATITNGFDPADLPPPAPPSPREPLRLLYVGSIIGTRTAATRRFFDALARLASEGITVDDLQVRLVGIFDPPIYAWARSLIECKIVEIVSFVPQAEAYAEMAAANALLLLASDDREGRLSHPNKLFEYFAVGRPVLAIAPEGDVTRLVREAGAGIAVAPGDVDRIQRAIRTLIADHRRGRLRYSTGYDSRFVRFERRELTRQLADRLDQLTT